MHDDTTEITKEIIGRQLGLWGQTFREPLVKVRPYDTNEPMRGTSHGCA
jgi:hypothetical protein